MSGPQASVSRWAWPLLLPTPLQTSASLLHYSGPGASAPPPRLVLTGHGTSQYWSRQPAEQVQVPLAGSQAAPLAHGQVWLQLSPQVPLEQGMEQSTPCHPAPTPPVRV